MPSSVASKQKVTLLKRAASRGEETIPRLEDTVQFPKPRYLDLLQTHPTSGQTATSRFKFDNVFSDHDSQQSVFRSVQGVVQSALEGHNVCIFA